MYKFQSISRASQLLLLFTVFSARCFGQEVVATAGGSFKNPDIEVNWTVGEIINETFVSQSLILTQGFQQSFEIVTGLAEESIGSGVFPNPFKNGFVIKGIDQNGPFSFVLSNAMNTQIYSEGMINGATHVDTEQLSQGFYLLRIFDKHGKVFRAYKLIKSSSTN